MFHVTILMYVKYRQSVKIKCRLSVKKLSTYTYPMIQLFHSYMFTQKKRKHP